MLFGRLFDRTGGMTIPEAHHGPASNGRFEYEPSYIVRGLTRLHVDLTP